MAQHGTLPLPDVSSRPMALGDQEHASSVAAARERRVTRHASRPALQNGGSGAGERACLQDNAAAPLVRYEDRERASPRRRSRYVPPPEAIADGQHVRRCLDVDMDENAPGHLSIMDADRTDSLPITDVERRNVSHPSAQFSFSGSGLLQHPQMQ